jgi:hypothetical protein
VHQAQYLTGSGLDLKPQAGPETDVTKLRMARREHE